MTDSKKEKSVPAGTEEAPPRRNRRQAIALAGAAAAGAAVAALGMDRGDKAHAGAGDPLILGAWNDAGDQQTTLQASVSSQPVFKGQGFAVVNVPSAGDGNALVGLGGAIGVAGHCQGGGAGVQGISLADSGWSDLGSAAGVIGETKSGIGVVGVSRNQLGEEPPAGPGTGVLGRSGSGVGVSGQSKSGPGVEGSSESGHGVGGATSGIPSPPTYPAGVVGVSYRPGAPPGSTDPEDFGSSLGVLGASGSGTGVVGTSETGIGTAGAAPGDAPGVVAFSGLAAGGPGGLPLPDGGLALAVEGKARFSTAGSGVVPARASAVTVSNEAITAASHITVTFTGDPGRASVAWVERQAGSGFIVHLAGRSPRDVPFTYLIVEPGT